MAKSILCPICKQGRWTNNDSDPDERPCERCVKKHRLDNFYGLALAILAQDITLGEPNAESITDTTQR